MKPTKLKPAIDRQILNFFGTCKPGDLLKTDDVWKYVKRHTGKQMDRETVNKYMRLLRQKEQINYTCRCKQTRDIEVLRFGEWHSL